MQRSGENDLTSNRFFYYFNTDFILTKWLSLHSKYGFNKVSDDSKREVKREGDLRNGGKYFESYTDKNNYKYQSSYFDIGLNFNKEIINNYFLNLNLGYSQNSVDYNREFERFYENSDGVFHNNGMKYEPKEKEKVWSTAVSLSNNYFTFEYLYNKTDYGFRIPEFYKRRI